MPTPPYSLQKYHWIFMLHCGCLPYCNVLVMSHPLMCWLFADLWWHVLSPHPVQARQRQALQVQVWRLLQNLLPWTFSYQTWAGQAWQEEKATSVWSTQSWFGSSWCWCGITARHTALGGAWKEQPSIRTRKPLGRQGRKQDGGSRHVGLGCGGHWWRVITNQAWEGWWWLPQQPAKLAHFKHKLFFSFLKELWKLYFILSHLIEVPGHYLSWYIYE